MSNRGDRPIPHRPIFQSRGDLFFKVEATYFSKSRRPIFQSRGTIPHRPIFQSRGTIPHRPIFESRGILNLV